MAVSAAGGAGAAHVSEALVEEAEGAFALALMGGREVGGILALGADPSAIAEVAILLALHAHSSHVAGAFFVVASGAALGAPLVVREVLRGLALQALVPPIALGAVLRTELTRSPEALRARQREEAIRAGPFALALGREEQAILALRAEIVVRALAASRLAGSALPVPGILPRVVPAVRASGFALLVVQVGAVGTQRALRLGRTLRAVLRTHRTGAADGVGAGEGVVALRAVQLAGPGGGQVGALLALGAHVWTQAGIAGGVANLAEPPHVAVPALVVAIRAFVVTPVRVGEVLPVFALLARGRVCAERAVLRAARAGSPHLAQALLVEAVWAAFIAGSRWRQVPLVLALCGIGGADASLHVAWAGRTGVAELVDALAVVAVRTGVLARLGRREVREVLTARALLLAVTVEAGPRADLAEAPHVLAALEVVPVWALVLAASCGCQVGRLRALGAHVPGLAEVAGGRAPVAVPAQAVGAVLEVSRRAL
mmetsp:Transcript_108427/g.258743  ORF Transcript_108427/g.258743 Transcript_108427/m.258743 type:complete len:487 (+) Transcript_108427:404-1864(+)